MILKSLVTLFAISGTLSFAFSSNLQSFAKVFLFTTLMQILFYNIYRTIVTFLMSKMDLEKIKELSMQGCELSCPCDKTIKNFIPIRLNQDNSYKCLECNKNVKVDLEFKSFLQTEPINLEKSNNAFDLVYQKTIKENE
jgi:hypothetical protein